MSDAQVGASFHRWPLGGGDEPHEGPLRTVFETWRDGWNGAFRRFGVFKAGDSMEASSFLAFDEVTALMLGDGACVALTLQRACDPSRLTDADRDYFACLPEDVVQPLLGGGPLWITAFFTVAKPFRKPRDGDLRWIPVYLELLARRFGLSGAPRMCVVPSRASAMHLAVRDAGARTLDEAVDYNLRGHTLAQGADVAMWERGERGVNAGLTSHEQRMVQRCWDERLGFEAPSTGRT